MSHNKGAFKPSPYKPTREVLNRFLELGYTNEQIAFKCGGVTTTTISRWVQGYGLERAPKPKKPKVVTRRMGNATERRRKLIREIKGYIYLMAIECKENA